MGLSSNVWFELIEISDIYDGVVEWYTGTGHARCRICGDKIAKGGRGVAFWFSPADDEAWWSREGKAHADCVEADASGWQQMVIDEEAVEAGLLRFRRERGAGAARFNAVCGGVSFAQGRRRGLRLE